MHPPVRDHIYSGVWRIHFEIRLQADQGNASVHPSCDATHLSVSLFWALTQVYHSIIDLATLTHWGRDKMAAISETTFSNAFSWVNFRLKFSLKFVPKGPIKNIQALVQIMAWRPPGDKQLAEPVMVSLLTHMNKQRVLMHRHQGWNVRHGLCHIYMRYLYIYELFIAFVCFVVCSLL